MLSDLCYYISYRTINDKKDEYPRHVVLPVTQFPESLILM